MIHQIHQIHQTFPPPKFSAIKYYIIMYVLCFCSALEIEAIPIDSIIEKCSFMDMTSKFGMVFVSQFPNRVEVE